MYSIFTLVYESVIEIIVCAALKIIFYYIEKIRVEKKKYNSTQEVSIKHNYYEKLCDAMYLCIGTYQQMRNVKTTDERIKLEEEQADIYEIINRIKEGFPFHDDEKIKEFCNEAIRIGVTTNSHASMRLVQGDVVRDQVNRQETWKDEKILKNEFDQYISECVHHLFL